jgi:pilus assembly protein CpaF
VRWERSGTVSVRPLASATTPLMFGRRAVDLPATVPSLGAAGSGGRPGALDDTATVAASGQPGKPALAARLSGSPDRRGETLKATLSRIQATLYERIDASAATKLPRDELNRQILELIGEIVVEQRMSLTTREQEALSATIIDDMVGLGPLEPLLRDDSITDIMVNGAHQVYVERRGKIELTDVQFRDNQHVMNVAQRIVTRIGRRVDETCPVCDARLEDGSRVNVIAPPLAIDGCAISIRKFAKKSITLDVMARQSNLSEALARVLKVASACRLNIVISGGTGSGKTTMLNAMSQLIDAGERVVTIEDAAELQLQQPHVVRLETRPPNLEGFGEITMRDLVRNALRMRPDRIICGEVRGPEALDMLQAMNTGHDGSMCTLHANSPREAITRMENMVGMAASNLPSKAVRAQIVGAVNLVLQVSRMRDGIRRVTHVTEIVGMEGDVVTTQDLFTFEYQGENRDGTLIGVFKPAPVRPYFIKRAAYFGLDRALMAAMQP